MLFLLDTPDSTYWEIHPRPADLCRQIALFRHHCHPIAIHLYRQSDTRVAAGGKKQEAVCYLLSADG